MTIDIGAQGVLLVHLGLSVLQGTSERPVSRPSDNYDSDHNDREYTIPEVWLLFRSAIPLIDAGLLHTWAHLEFYFLHAAHVCHVLGPLYAVS